MALIHKTKKEEGKKHKTKKENTKEVTNIHNKIKE